MSAVKIQCGTDVGLKQHAELNYMEHFPFVLLCTVNPSLRIRFSVQCFHINKIYEDLFRSILIALLCLKV